MSIMSYNGSAVVAMTGRNCFAIASDMRFGVQMETISMDFPKIFELGPHVYLGLSGLATDILTVAEKLKFRVRMYELKENRRIDPETLMCVTSNLLYKHRFGPYFTEPIIAGLDPVSGKPMVGSMDLIGCPMLKSDFVVAGTSSEQLYGMSEVLWQPDMSPDELFEAISQTLLNAQDRDCLAGWGAVVYVVEKDKVTVKHLKARMD